jgi:hypothetical protein
VSRIIIEGTKNPFANEAIVNCYSELGIYTSAPKIKEVVTSDFGLYRLDHGNGYGVNFARDFNDSLCIFDEPCGSPGETWHNSKDNSTIIDKGNGNAFLINSSGGVDTLVYTGLHVGDCYKDFLTYLGRMGEPSITTYYAGALVLLNQRMQALETSTKKEDLDVDLINIQEELKQAKRIAEVSSSASQQAYKELTEKIGQNLRPKIESSILDVQISKDKKRRRKPNFKY